MPLESAWQLAGRQWKFCKKRWKSSDMAFSAAGSMACRLRRQREERKKHEQQLQL